MIQLIKLVDAWGIERFLRPEAIQCIETYKHNYEFVPNTDRDNLWEEVQTKITFGITYTVVFFMTESAKEIAEAVYEASL